MVIDQLDVLTMQNWSHLQVTMMLPLLRLQLIIPQLIFEYLNKIPKQSHDTDFSRIKPWYLDGQCVDGASNSKPHLNEE